MTDCIFCGVLGFIGGVLLLCGLIRAAGSSPRQLEEKHHNAAVSRGFARWVMDTNTIVDGRPYVRFEWNK